MKWLISKGKAGKQISIKNLLSILMVGIFIVIGIGISGLWANEDNTENNVDFSYQNAAQAQHAHNVAIQATLQDPEVAKGFAHPRASKDPKAFKMQKNCFMINWKILAEQNFRYANHLVWDGAILRKHLDVHPSFLGRGRYLREIFWQT